MSQRPRTPIPLVREANHRLPDPARCTPREQRDGCSATPALTSLAPPSVIAVCQIRAGDRLVPVELIQNEGGSVAARFLIGSTDTPVIDAPSADEALATVEAVIEGVLLARRSGAA